MKLRLVTPQEDGERKDPGVIYMVGEDLAYNTETETVILSNERSDLIKCSDLKEILSRCLIKGSKFIINTYNPTLYNLIPGISENDELFNSDNGFIPTIPVQDLIRGEVSGFNVSEEVTQESIRSIKACDNWYNDVSMLRELEGEINDRVQEIFGYYKEFDAGKEVRDKVGDYSINFSSNTNFNSIVVVLTSETTYTDTINLEDWIYSSLKGGLGISGKLDISFMYSKDGKIYSGVQTIKAFRYEEYITVEDTIIDLGDIQLEYIGYVLKVYPLSDNIDEVIISDCTLTIGVL